MKKTVGISTKFRVEMYDLFNSTDVIISDKNGIELYSRNFAKHYDAEIFFEKLDMDYNKYLPDEFKDNEESKKPFRHSDYWKK